MLSKLGAADGEEVAKKPAPTGARYLPPGSQGSPRNPVPSALVLVLTTLIEELEDIPSQTRVELRSIRSRLCRVFKLNDPQGPANASELAWEQEHDQEIPE